MEIMNILLLLLPLHVIFYTDFFFPPLYIFYFPISYGDNPANESF